MTSSFRIRLGALVLLAGTLPALSAETVEPSAREEGQRAVRSGQIKIDRPVGSTTEAPAQVIATMNTDDWMETARASGYTDLVLREGSDPKTKQEKVIDGKSGGVDVALNLYGCEDDGECSGMAFTAYFGKQEDVGPKMINGYNSTHMAHLVAGEDGDLTLRFLVYFSHGVTKDYLADMAQVFGLSIKEAVEYKP